MLNIFSDVAADVFPSDLNVLVKVEAADDVTQIHKPEIDNFTASYGPAGQYQIFFLEGEDKPL